MDHAVRVFLDSIGCRLNQSELEGLAHELLAAGVQVVAEVEASDVVLLNTCAVTGAAAADSRSRARMARRRSPRATIVLTGCWATLEPEQAKRVVPEALVVPNAHKGSIARLVSAAGAPPSRDPLARPNVGGRQRQRAFIKVQEGCDHRCAFCVTTLARGSSRSVPAESIVSHVERAVRSGASEIVLCGVQLGAYGREAPMAPNLAGLVRRILQDTPAPRLRFSSLEPWDVTGELLALWDDARMCPSLHLPLQSGSERVLRRMRRPISKRRFQATVDEARRAIPSLALTTDIMVGFPGESEAEFEESLAFVHDLHLAGAHVFAFSPRPGTAAEAMPGRIPPPVAQQRSEAVRQVVEGARRQFLEDLVGAQEEVIWLRQSSRSRLTDSWIGITRAGLPLTAQAPSAQRGGRAAVRIVGTDAHGWLGQPLPLRECLSGSPCEASP